MSPRPRRNRQKELEFDIHVDPSCVNEFMEEARKSMGADKHTTAAAQRAEDPIQYPAMDPWNDTAEAADSQETTPLADPEAGTVHDDEAEIDADADAEVPNWRRESGVSSGSYNSERRESLQSVGEEDHSYFSESGRQAYVADESHISAGDEGHANAGAEEGDDSSSHHDQEDVFSDHSPRSSMGSASEIDQAKMEAALQQKTRSPRISGFSQYDQDEDFVPTIRGAPRPAFRSPSSVKAMQMSSPPSSVKGSGRRSTRNAVSRLGSPSVSTQYSPKKTPPRFKRNTPPLVLLHVTLLPLRWGWGDVLDNAQTSDLTEEGKILREAWRHLQDRTGDTVADRGILLPHPQNDFEVLEERLLEALELPLRRRARILECGHYLGPSNEMTIEEDIYSDDEEDNVQSPRESIAVTTHWCRTCNSDIRYDSLGPGKIFRVKVYASNGLMKAGAWSACWKEMERVDVEIEPLIDHRMLDELGHLAAEQERALEMQEAENILAETAGIEDEDEAEEQEEEHHDQSFMAQESSQTRVLHSSPEPEIRLDSSPVFEDRRRRDEERLREIYGETTQKTEPASAKPRTSDFVPQETPPSPSAQAFERRQERRPANKSGSLPELVFEALRVLMQDKKNAMIAFLGVLILALAMRGGSPAQDPVAFHAMVKEAAAAQVSQAESRATSAAFATASTGAGYTPADSASIDSGDACMPCSLALEAAQASLFDMQATATPVAETVTETITETSAVEATATQTPFQDAEAVDASVNEATEAIDETDVEVEEADRDEL